MKNKLCKEKIEALTFSQNEREKETLTKNETQATAGVLYYALIIFFSHVKSPNYWALQFLEDVFVEASRLFKS